jgi:hypothetical protein
MKLLTAIFSILFVTACSSTPTTPTSTAPDAKAPVTEKKVEAKTSEKTAKVAASASGDNVTCKLAKVERTINIVKNDDSCVVEYTKDGNKSEIATGNLTSTYCKEVQDRVRNNLAASGYDCK